MVMTKSKVKDAVAMAIKGLIEGAEGAHQILSLSHPSHRLIVQGEMEMD